PLRPHPLPGAGTRGIARPPVRGSGCALPDLQRGLPVGRRERGEPTRSGERGTPPGGGAGGADARRGRDLGATCVDAAERITPPGEVRTRWGVGPSLRAGSFALGPRPRDSGTTVGSPVPPTRSPRPVPDPSRHRRRPQRCANRGRYRLEPDLGPLRPAHGPHTVTSGRIES